MIILHAGYLSRYGSFCESPLARNEQAAFRFESVEVRERLRSLVCGDELIAASRTVGTLHILPRSVQTTCLESAQDRGKSIGRHRIRTCDFHRVRMAL